MKKLLFFLILISGVTLSKGQEFEIRYTVVDCNTIRIQSRCVSNATDNPSNGETIFGFNFNLITPSGNTLSLSVANNYSDFTIAAQGSGTENGFQYYAFVENVGFSVTGSNEWTLNSWQDICDIDITSGNTNIQIATSSELPVQDGSYIFTDVYPSTSEMGLGTNVGTLIKTWTAATDANWSTASNWCPSGVPVSAESVQIPDLTTDPVISGSVSSGPLEIQNGAILTISGTTTLTVNGAISGAGTIAGSSTASLSVSGTGAGTLNMDQTSAGSTNRLLNLTLNNSSGLTLGNATQVMGVLTPTSGTLTTNNNLTLVATGTGSYGQISGNASGNITGNITMEKFLSNTNAGWRHFYLPLTGTLSGFNSSTLELQYSSPQNVQYWDASINTGNTAKGWQPGTAGSGNSLGGFTIYSDNAGGGNFDFTQTISFTGTYTSGDRNFTLHGNTDDPNAGSAGAEAEGWHFIGNPYPSNLDIAAMFTDWTSNGDLDYSAIHVYDAVSGQYKAILGNGETLINTTGYNTSGGVDNTTTVLAPFQAFWVKAGSGETTFGIDSVHRTTSATGLGHYMKKSYDLARFDVLDPNGKFDQTVVYFHENGTPRFDKRLEGYKLVSFNSDVPSLYAVNEDGNFSITALSSTEFEHSVPMGFRSNTHGTMTLSLNTGELDNKWFVYVEDKQLGIYYDIKAKPYTFEHTQNSDSRYVIHFKQHALSTGRLVENVNSMAVTGNGEEVYVFVPEFYRSQYYQIEVFDLQGRLVYTNNSTELKNGMNTLNLRLENSAIYVVRVKSTEGMVSGKVQIF